MDNSDSSDSDSSSSSSSENSNFEFDLDSLTYRQLATYAKSIDSNFRVRGTKNDIKSKIIEIQKQIELGSSNNNNKDKSSTTSTSTTTSSSSSSSNIRPPKPSVFKSNNNNNRSIKIVNIIRINLILNQLKIKDISNNELLFWKLIKNKIIFKSITDKLKINKFTPNYYEIVNVGSMISNNQIQLLKYKLLNNQQQDEEPLDFTFKSISTKLFKTYKKDKEFYKLLFKRFPQYYPPSSTTTPPSELTKLERNELLEITVNKSLDEFSNNSIVLEIMMSGRYKFKPSVNTLKIALSNLNFKAILMLLEYDIGLFKNNKDECWGELIKLKFDTHSNHQFKKVYKIFNLLIDHFNLIPPTSISTLNLLRDKLFTICPFASKFKICHLKNACISISIINQLIDQFEVKDRYIQDSEDEEEESNDESNEGNDDDDEEQKRITLKRKRNYKSYKLNKKKVKSESFTINNQYNLTREEIEDFQFTNNEINSKLGHLNNSFHDVKLLLKMYYSMKLKNLKNNTYYKLIFKEKPTYTGCLIQHPKHGRESKLVLSLKYGDSRLFQRWFKHEPFSVKYGIYNWFNSIIEKKKYYDGSSNLFFKYCKDDKKKQKQFIRLIISIIFKSVTTTSTTSTTTTTTTTTTSTSTASTTEVTPIPKPVPTTTTTSNSSTVNNQIDYSLLSLIFSMLVYHNDIDLLRFAFYKTEFKLNQISSNFNWGLIKSKSILKFIFDRFKPNVNYNFSLWFIKDRTDLFIYHQELIKSKPKYWTSLKNDTSTTVDVVTAPSIKYSKFKTDLIKGVGGIRKDIENSVGIIKFIISNPSIFSIDLDFNLIKFLLNSIRNETSNYNIEDIQFIVNNSSQFKFEHLNSYRFQNDLVDSQLPVYECLIKNNIMNEKLKSNLYAQDRLFIAILISGGGNFKLLSEQFSNSRHDPKPMIPFDFCKNILNRIIERNDFNSVKQLIKELFQNESTIRNYGVKKFLDFLKDIIDNGNLTILKEINYNFRYILNSNTFTMDSIRKLLFYSIDQDNIDIFSFLTSKNTTITGAGIIYNEQPIVNLSPSLFETKANTQKSPFIFNTFKNKYKQNIYQHMIFKK